MNKIYTGRFLGLIVIIMLMGALVYHMVVMGLNLISYQKKNLVLLLTMKKRARVSVTLKEYSPWLQMLSTTADISNM